FDEVFTIADPDSSWSERGIAVVFLASGGVGKAAKGIKLADDLFDGAKAIDKARDADKTLDKSSELARFSDEAVEAGRASRYSDNLSKKGSIPNRSTNVHRDDFEKNLAANGWARSEPKPGVAVFEKDGAKYSIYPEAKSTSGPSAGYTQAGSSKPTLKIRLGE
ncbi:MAG: hypothetical protein ACYC5A_10455, partial [Thermoleophilia bacterium]